MSFVEIKGIKKHYGQGDSYVDALSDVNMNIEKGQIVVLLGPSGSGKSTLLNIIGAIEDADEGYIAIDGEKIEDMNEKKLTLYRRKHLGYVFQMYNLIPNLTVRENIEVGAYLGKDSLDVDELMKTLGIYEQRSKTPSQLSGGQQQRCAIARALIKNPKLLLCDEPTGALDSKTSRDILILLEKINKKYGTTMLIVTHNNSIKNMVHKVIVIKDGQIIKDYENEKIVPAAELEDL